MAIYVSDIHGKKGTSKSSSVHDPAGAPWEIDQQEYLRIECRETIDEMLVDLKYEQTPCVLISNDGGNFGDTRLIEFSHNVLTFVEPIGFSKRAVTSLKLYFRDKNMLWNCFEIRVVGKSGDSLHTTHPQAMFQLERRENARQEAPAGTSVFVYQKGIFLYGGYVKDLSATGMLVFGREEQAGQLDKDSEFDEITLNLPDKPLLRVSKVVNAEYTLVIGKGKVVRTFYDEKSQCMFYGVSFEDRDGRFEKALQNYFA